MTYGRTLKIWSRDHSRWIFTDDVAIEETYRRDEVWPVQYDRKFPSQSDSEKLKTDNSIGAHPPINILFCSCILD